MRVPAEFFDQVVFAVPELAALRTDHEREYGELLGHVLMAEILRWACRTIEADRAAVDRLLTVLGQHLEPGDDPVSNIISVSFLENLGTPGAPPQEREIRQRLPDVLSEELTRVEAERQGH